jgi:hypothetical protein
MLVQDWFGGIFFVIFGIGMAICRKYAAISAVKWNTRLWHCSATEDQYRLIFFICGGIFTIFGFLLLTGIIATRA